MILKKYNLEKHLNLLGQLLNERTNALEIGLNDHFYKKLKLDILGLIADLGS